MSNRLKILELIKIYFPDLDIESFQIQIDSDNAIKIETHKIKNGVTKIEHPLSKHIEEKYFQKSVSGDIFYHFVPLKYVFTILKEKKLRLYNLEYKMIRANL